MFGLEGGRCVVVEQTEDSVWIVKVYLSFVNVIKWYSWGCQHWFFGLFCI